jgi:hypothetical protein
MFKDKNDLANHMIQGIDDGTLVTPKHTVANLATPTSGYKTVVVPDPNDLKLFFSGGAYTAKLYKNNDPRHTDPYVVITPDDSTYVSASGVPPMSSSPSHPCDVFVAASGLSQGVHLFGEESTNVKAKESSGKITFLTDLT